MQPINPQFIQIIGGAVGGVPRSYVEHTAFGITPTQVATQSWTFIWRAPQRRIGCVRLFAAGNAAEGGGNTRNDYIYTKNSVMRSEASVADFDGDGRFDAVRKELNNLVWYILNSSNGAFQIKTFGLETDNYLVPNDYDGDNKADIAVWRKTNGIFYIEKSSGGFQFTQWGANPDFPVAAYATH